MELGEKIRINGEYRVQGRVHGVVPIPILLPQNNRLGAARTRELYCQCRRIKTIFRRGLFVLGYSALHRKPPDLTDEIVNRKVVCTHRWGQHQIPDPFGVLFQGPALSFSIDVHAPDLIHIQRDRTLVSKIKLALLKRRLQIACEREDARIPRRLRVKPAAGRSLITEQKRELLRIGVRCDLNGFGGVIQPEVFQA